MSDLQTGLTTTTSAGRHSGAVEFACSPMLLPGALVSRHMQVRLTGNSKLPMGVIVGVNSCLSL